MLQLSTDLPKGATITHGNIVATEAAVMTVIPNLGSKDVCLAYLLLAHIFEIAAESVMLAAGVAIGYATLMTLTGTSNKIKEGFTNQGHTQQEISSLSSLSKANLKCNRVSKLASKSNKHYLL